jgi:hypothetical protein
MGERLQRYFGDTRHGLFDTNQLHSRWQPIWRDMPALVIDNFFVAPTHLRNAALKLAFRDVPGTYPGRQAHVPRGDEDLLRFHEQVLDIVCSTYMPEINRHLRPLSISRVKSDFAVVDTHPDQLSDEQRMPHTDPVPIFGLVYLSIPPRGGTVFFQEVDTVDPGPADGYFVEGNARWAVTGKVDGTFNRCVFYPGSIPHSGEIVGHWIKNQERFNAPRLTLRMLFS